MFRIELKPKNPDQSIFLANFGTAAQKGEKR